MDRLSEYREIIKRLLRYRETISQPSLPEGLEVTALLDDETSQYALMSTGWWKGERVNGTILLLRIKNGKIWVEDDGSDSPIANDLLEAGVPCQNIVLGFQPPQHRQLTGFAVA